MENWIITLILVWVLVWLVYVLVPLVRRIIWKTGTKGVAWIFDNNYIRPKAFYLYRFRTIPSLTGISQVDATKAYNFIRTEYAEEIDETYQNCSYNYQEGCQQFDVTLLVFKNRLMVEIQNGYVQVLYPARDYEVAALLVNSLAAFKMAEKEEDYEINIITLSASGLELKRLDIKPTQLDLSVYYNDDFREVDAVIKQRLNRENDKGIVLLHGLPGTGKTTYLRHLIGEINKKVLFVSPSVAGNLMNPEFIDLLIDNPNSVLVIEDAEHIMMDRKHQRDSSVSNLLNISDGLLSDCLNVQIICTFNSALNLIDSALMRKGRMIARYEFGKLTLEKAQALSKHLGFDTNITRPMTLAEVAGQDEQTDTREPVAAIGFRRAEELMN